MSTRRNRRLLRNVAGAAAVLFLSASLPTLAQRQGGTGRGQRPNNGGQGNPAGGLFGGIGSIMNSPMGAQMSEMLNKMRQSRAFVDPGVSQTSNLLTRSDVRNELVLNGRQTETIANLQNGYPAAMMQGVMTTVMSSIQKMQAEGGTLDFRAMSPDDRQQFITQIRDKAVESTFAVQADQNTKAEAILTPAQTKRLRELDMQWRGPLALSDEKLAEQVNLTAEQKGKFAAMLKELRDARMKAQASMFNAGGPGGFGNIPGANSAKPPAAPSTGNANGANNVPTSPGGANDQGGQTGKPATPGATPNATPNPASGRNPTAPPSQEQMQQAIDESSKQSEALLKATEKKALLLLTPEQQAQWKMIQGKPFTFRQYL